jgi:adenylosuccinate lyase
MRRYGVAGGYEDLKALSQGKAMTQDDLDHFVRVLDLPAPARHRLLTLTPATYTGLAEQLAKLVGVPGTLSGP